MKIHYLLIASVALASCKKQITASAQISADDKTAPSKTIQFSGYTWNVRNSKNNTQGPGKNLWDPNDVWVDTNGYLHVKIRKDAATGKWYCAEVSTQQTFGYGAYQFWVEGAIDKFDKNIVLGLFNYSGYDGYDEMDIEIARWGNSNWPNLNYTIYPQQGKTGIYNYTKEFSLSGTYTTHRFTRTATSVKLQAMNGFTETNTNQFASATCTNPPYFISTIAMPAYINLWLFKGHAPTDGNEVEVVIRKFTYTP